jgi:hypothetical protein
MLVLLIGEIEKLLLGSQVFLVNRGNYAQTFTGSTLHVILSPSGEVGFAIFLVVEGFVELLHGVGMTSHSFAESGAVTFAIVADFHDGGESHSLLFALIILDL